MRILIRPVIMTPQTSVSLIIMLWNFLLPAMVRPFEMKPFLNIHQPILKLNVHSSSSLLLEEIGTEIRELIDVHGDAKPEHPSFASIERILESLMEEVNNVAYINPDRMCDDDENRITINEIKRMVKEKLNPNTWIFNVQEFRKFFSYSSFVIFHLLF